MKKILFLFCLIMHLFFEKPIFSEISKPTEFIPQAFDIIHYDISLDLTKGLNKFISGKSKMFFVWKERPAISCFYFHLKDLSVDSAFFDDSIYVSPELQSDSEIDYVYYQICNLIGEIGDTHSITVYYSGEATMERAENPFGGVFLTDSILFAIGVGFRSDYVSTTQHWLACYDHPSDKATYRIRFSVPAGFRIATNGITKFIGKANDSTEIWETSSSFPIATYLLTFAMGRFLRINPGKEFLPQNLDYSIYCSPLDSTAVDWAFHNFYHSFFAMQNRWGKYPFEKIGFVVIPFNSGAMEHQTMVTFPRSVVQQLYNNRDSLNIMACHEFAHQWFGNSVSPLDFRDVWFNESFATYSESIFLEQMLGEEAYFKKLLSDKGTYIKYIVGYEGPIPLYDFPRKMPSSNYPATIYYKGSVVLGMLRYHLGNELFFDMIRRYLDLNAYSSKSTFDFVQFCESFSGQNLQWFFNQWVYGKGYPIFEIRVNKKQISDSLASALLHFRQIQPKSYGSYLNVPVEINFLLADSSRFDTVVVVPSVDSKLKLDSIPNFVSLNFNGGKKVIGLYTFVTYLGVDNEIRENSNDIFWSNLTRTLNINGICYGKSQITIYDLSGKVLSSQYFDTFENESVALELPPLTNGIYYIHLICNNKQFMKQIIIY